MSPAILRPHPPRNQPPYLTPAYGSTLLRAPRAPLVAIPPAAAGTEGSGPRLSPARHRSLLDLSRTARGEAVGERIIVEGRVTDEDGRPERGARIEVWQANAAGRYHHANDLHDAPLDPHFEGVGGFFTDGDGRYRFTTIKPGAYPWKNHSNAWRPNHIHFSLSGESFGARLVTQMYFPGDPLLALDPIYQSIPDPAARERLISRFDIGITQPEWALGYRFDIVLRGPGQTPFEGRP